MGASIPRDRTWAICPTWSLDPTVRRIRASVCRPTWRASVRARFSGPVGRRIVIHAKPDDERTDPSGNSGERVACAVIEPG